MKGDEENDSWIFALSVLLSSTFVYNCLSTINQDGLTKFHYVTEMTKRIKARDKQTNENGEEFFKFFPNFVWVLRDFDLDIDDEEGKPITADEYLASALQLKEGTTTKIHNYNKPRQCIQQFFEDKRCFVFPLPVHGPGMVKKLEKLSDSQLEPTFLRAAEEFCTYIYTRTFPKTVKGQPIQGKMFCHLLETYLGVIQGGKIPCVENAVKNMAERENAEAAEVSFNFYEENMKKCLQESVKTEEDLSKSHLDCSSKALKMFMSMSILDENQKSQTHLKAKMKRAYTDFCRQWERDHGGSESVNDDLEKKNRQLRTEAEESNQHLLQLQKKLQQEKENTLKEIERKTQQREIEVKALKEKNCALLEHLSQQAELLDSDRKQVKSDLETIFRGGEAFALFLKVSGSVLTTAIAGALVGQRIEVIRKNQLLMAVVTVMGGVAGLAAGIASTWW